MDSQKKKPNVVRAVDIDRAAGAGAAGAGADGWSVFVTHFIGEEKIQYIMEYLKHCMSTENEQ